MKLFEKPMVPDLQTPPVTNSVGTTRNTANDEVPNYSLVWVFCAPIADRLDNATWLETTRELRKLGWKVTLIAKGPSGTQCYRGVDTLCITVRDIYFIRHLDFHAKVARFILRNWDQLDVVLFNQESGIYLFPFRLLRAIKRDRFPKLVMDTRDRRDAVPGSLKTKLRLTFNSLNQVMAAAFADGQTTITRKFAELTNIPADKIWGIWPSGVNVEPFAAASEQRRWPAADQPIKLVYTGILLEKRHLLELCQAVKRANQQGLSFELHIYGDGPDAEAVYHCADSSDRAVIVHQPIVHEAIPEILAQMHVGVTSLPDVSDEKYAASSPIKLFEYLASGLPILATKNSCHTDVVGQGPYAFWIEETTVPGILSGLEQIWQHRHSLAALGKAAQVDVEHWTWKAAASKLDQALRTGISGGDSLHQT